MNAPWKKRSVKLAQWETTIFEGGRGPRLLYLHGMLGNPGWHPFLAELAKDWTVVAPCLPGFNDATPCDHFRSIHDWVFALSEVLDAADAAGVPAVAASTGAMIALELEALRPGTFRAIALLSPLGFWNDDHPVADVFSERTGDQPAMLLNFPDKASAFYADGKTPDPAQAELKRYRTRRSAASLVWPLPDHGLADRIHRVGAEAFLCWGEKDRTVPAGYRRLFADRLPNVTGEAVIPEAGHLLEWDQPELAADAVAGSIGAAALRREVVG